MENARDASVNFCAWLTRASTILGWQCPWKAGWRGAVVRWMDERLMRGWVGKFDHAICFFVLQHEKLEIGINCCFLTRLKLVTLVLSYVRNGEPWHSCWWRQQG